MKEGQMMLVETLKDTLMLAEKNPCRASDVTLMSLARGMKAFLSSEVSMDLSRDSAARFLGMSTRNLGRKVQDGSVPKPERHGHKALSFSALKLVRLLTNGKRGNEE